MQNKEAFQWNEKAYQKRKFGAQRRYPNEELIRFLASAFFQKKRSERKKIKILELGCGTCANLWMIAREGFDSYGIDISPKAIKLGKAMLKSWGVDAYIKVGDITALPYGSMFFNCVIDVLCMHSLPQRLFQTSLDEIYRVLKQKGLFFSYSPSVNSDAFRRYKPSKKIDAFTLNGIRRIDAPYAGNIHPFRFISPKGYKKILEMKGFKVIYLETVLKTYNTLKEKFEFVTIRAQKK